MQTLDLVEGMRPDSCQILLGKLKFCIYFSNEKVMAPVEYYLFSPSVHVLLIIIAFSPGSAVVGPQVRVSQPPSPSRIRAFSRSLTIHHAPSSTANSYLAGFQPVLESLRFVWSVDPPAAAQLADSSPPTRRTKKQDRGCLQLRLSRCGMCRARPWKSIALPLTSPSATNKPWNSRGATLNESPDWGKLTVELTSRDEIVVAY